ncbi:MAG: peptidylprolyl isomerase [Pseudomonadota bacterium]|nr:peptidylprolyl isomerase [Pseudomonadota bacterium]
MRSTAAFACLLLAACVHAPPAPPPPAEPEPSARYTFWRPAPVLDAREPSEVLAATTAADWRPIDPENLLILDLADGGRVAIELAPDFAPVHVANIRAFARAGWWNDATVYRVQDNYVVQWGNGDAEVPLPPGVVRTPPAEYDRALEGLSVRPLGFPDSYAPIAGHAGGWPIGYDPESGRAWLTHCYGSVGVGRNVAPDTGTGGELYAVIGHAPRHLDLNIANVGRVVDGMTALSARPRGSGNLGFYDAERGERPIPIARIRLASDMPAAERPSYEAMRTDTDAFAAYVTGRANRGGSFFIRPAGGIDVCNVAVPVRRRGS